MINWQNPSVLFWQLIEILLKSFLVILKFRSTAKIRQFFFGSWSNFSINWKVSKILVNWLWKFRSTDKTQFRSSDFRSNDPLSIKLYFVLRLQNNFFFYFLGPDVWPGECTTGRSQSPIDIPSTDDNVKLVNFDPLVFENYEKFPKVETVSNIGLSIELTLSPEEQKMQPKVRTKDK